MATVTNITPTTATIEIDGKTITRKITHYGALKTIALDSKMWYIQNSSDWYGKPYLVEISGSSMVLFKKYKRHTKTWTTYHSFLDTMPEQYAKYQTNDTSVPGGSNTSTMREIHRGDIAKVKGQRYGVNQYSGGTYFHVALTIGTNFPASRELVTNMIVVSSMFSGSCGYNNSPTPATLSVIYGSAFTAVGLG